jgi:hypothetical protein
LPIGSLQRAARARPSGRPRFQTSPHNTPPYFCRPRLCLAISIVEVWLIALWKWPDWRSAQSLIAAHLFVEAGARPKSLSCLYQDRSIEAELLNIAYDIAIYKRLSSPEVHKERVGFVPEDPELWKWIPCHHGPHLLEACQPQHRIVDRSIDQSFLAVISVF